MKLLFLNLSLFLFISAFSQEKIEGLGKFKLKVTTVAYIDTFAKERKFGKAIIRSFADYMEVRFKKDKVAEVFPDTVNFSLSPDYSHYCRQTRVFYIPEFDIASIKLSGTYLIFHNNNLVSIKTDYRRDVVEALELKYGSGAKSTEEKEITCTIKLTGQDVKHTETTNYQTWENGDIKCTVTAGTYYDSNCKERPMYLINFILDGIIEKVLACDAEASVQIQKRSDEKKKAQLKDF